MAYTAGLAPGDVLTAATMNSIGDAWTAFNTFTINTLGTPNFAVGNATRTGYYSQVNKLITCRYQMTWGSTTTNGNGTWFFTVPTNLASSYVDWMPIGTAVLYDNGGSYFPATVCAASASAVKITYDGEALNVNYLFELGSANSPFTFGNGDKVFMSFQYEAA